MFSVLIDGICFQEGASSAARAWEFIIREIAKLDTINIYVLDRGGAPDILRTQIIPFPSYSFRYTAEDSFMIQDICDLISARVFISTGYTTPISTTAVQAIFSLNSDGQFNSAEDRYRKEREIAISFAEYFVTESVFEKDLLLQKYPEVGPDNVYAGDHDWAMEATRNLMPADLSRSISKVTSGGYVLFDFSEQRLSDEIFPDIYIDSYISFAASLGIASDVVCLSSVQTPERNVKLRDGTRIKVYTVGRQDSNLFDVYENAIVVVHPRPSDFARLALIEAISAGLPVVVVIYPGLEEFEATSNIRFMRACNPADVAKAIVSFKSSGITRNLSLLSSKDMIYQSYNKLVSAFVTCLTAIDADSSLGIRSEFYEKWRRLRLMQANVDVERMI